MMPAKHLRMYQVYCQMLGIMATTMADDFGLDYNVEVTPSRISVQPYRRFSFVCRALDPTKRAEVTFIDGRQISSDSRFSVSRLSPDAVNVEAVLGLTERENGLEIR
ncbi:unnamed protein product [Protopolystoma xenopodis]|uniref:Uncharacterized protein n=1 Tax=Protopolystoma xenopodis TaxID=117903 RepID=A0A448XK40_9PLAT|nr:unnamed protein product [Protopolystoma xenopodis]